VVSHISQKTSEIWGTRGPFGGEWEKAHQGYLNAAKLMSAWEAERENAAHKPAGMETGINKDLSLYPGAFPRV
jgi:hypothetical protein